MAAKTSISTMKSFMMTYLGLQGLRQYGGDDGFRLRHEDR